jgi:hypothetical protein
VNRVDLQTISHIRLNEGQGLYDAGLYCGAYYLTGYAIECALKSAICKQVNQHDFPAKKLAVDSFTHDLIKLLDISGLKTAFESAVQANPALELNWSIVKDWTEQSRYRHDISQAMANDLIEASITQPDGVHPWLTTQW